MIRDNDYIIIIITTTTTIIIEREREREREIGNYFSVIFKPLSFSHLIIFYQNLSMSI